MESSIESLIFKRGERTFVSWGRKEWSDKTNPPGMYTMAPNRGLVTLTLSSLLDRNPICVNS